MVWKVILLYLFSFALSVGAGITEPAATATLADGNASVIQSMAVDIYQKYISSHKVLAPPESPEVEVVNGISSRVISAVTNYYKAKKATKELEGISWETHLIEETKVDAWCLPGGKIAVYSSLMPLTQSDAALAVILSHEIAHILLKHGDVRMKQYLKEFLGGKELAASLSAKPAETTDFYKMAFGNGDYVGVIRGFNAADEMAADKLGAIFCGLAGYNPEETIVFWERMNSLKWTGRQPLLLSTHPMYEQRMPKLKEIIDDIVKEYYKPIKKT